MGPLAFSLTCGTACEQTDDGLRASAGYSRVVVSRIKKGGTPTYVTPTMPVSR